MSSSNLKPSPSDRALARLRLDARLEPLRANRGALMVPRGGWLRSVRRALGLTLEDMAGRLGIARSSVARLETSEQKGTIQLDSLRRAAEVLNCELVYALIPKEPLVQAVEKQRLEVARQLNAKVRTHMSLEAQDTHDDAGLDKWREDRAVSLIGDRQLWKSRK